MDEMKYPVLCGWIPAQVRLELTGSNALVSGLNEVLGDSESFLSSYSPWFWLLFPIILWAYGLLDVGNEQFGCDNSVYSVF